MAFSKTNEQAFEWLIERALVGKLTGRQSLCDSRFVTTLLDGNNYFLGLFGKKYCVCHFLQRIDKCRNVFFALKTREFCPRLMGFGNVVFDSLHIARVSKESIARRTDLIGVDAIRFLLGLTDSYALDGTQNLFQTGDKACILYIKN